MQVYVWLHRVQASIVPIEAKQEVGQPCVYAVEEENGVQDDDWDEEVQAVRGYYIHHCLAVSAMESLRINALGSRQQIGHAEASLLVVCL